MAAAPSASLLGALLGLQLGAITQETTNRFAFDGLASTPGPDGTLQVGIRRFEAASLRVASGGLTAELGQLSLQRIAGQLRSDGGRPRLQALEAASAEISGVKVQGPLVLAGDAQAWSLAPLAALDGVVRAKIVDAQLLFDADVTVPIRHGQVDFNAATVEHVGPDSRMGVSRLGFYVDAPNGRSYLYQFPSTAVSGVEYERRGALLGAMVSDRGRLRLQEFGEALLAQPRAGQALGFTEQARVLFARTAVSGDLQPGDGTFAAPGIHAELAGRAQGRNAVRLHSDAVGRGLTVEMPALSVRNVALDLGELQLRCAEVAGPLVLRLSLERGELRFAFELASTRITGLRLQPRNAGGA